MAKKVHKVLTKLLDSGYVCNFRVTEYLESLYALNLKNAEQLCRIEAAIKVVFARQAEALSGYTIKHGLFLKTVYKALPDKKLICGFLMDALYLPSEPVINFIEKTKEAREMLVGVKLNFQAWKPQRLDRFLTNVPGLTGIGDTSLIEPSILAVLLKHSVS